MLPYYGFLFHECKFMIIGKTISIFYTCNHENFLKSRVGKFQWKILSLKRKKILRVSFEKM